MPVAVPGVTKVSCCFSQKHLGFFSLQLVFSTAAGLLQLFLSSQIVTDALQPQPSHMKGVSLSGGTFLDAARYVGSSRTSRESSWLTALGMQSLHRTHKFTVRWHQQFPSKLCWDFTLEAACKFNKYCNIFVRQLY